jgi:hypothetical protein
MPYVQPDVEFFLYQNWPSIQRSMFSLSVDPEPEKDTVRLTDPLQTESSGVPVEIEIVGGAAIGHVFRTENATGALVAKMLPSAS